MQTITVIIYSENMKVEKTVSNIRVVGGESPYFFS